MVSIEGEMYLKHQTKKEREYYSRVVDPEIAMWCALFM